MAPLPPPPSNSRRFAGWLRTEETFVIPETRRRASGEITRLRRRRRKSPGDRAWEEYLAETAKRSPALRTWPRRPS